MPGTPLPVPTNRSFTSTRQEHLDDHNAFADVVNNALDKRLFDVKGDLLVATGPDAVVRVPIGSNGQVLQADSNQPSGLKWATPSAGSGSSLLTVSTTKTSAYTITTADQVVVADATSAAFTLLLPTAVGNGGKVFDIKRINAGTNAVTIDANGSQTIDGAATYVLQSQWEAVRIVSNNSNWLVLETFRPQVVTAPNNPNLRIYKQAADPGDSGDIIWLDTDEAYAPVPSVTIPGAYPYTMLPTDYTVHVSTSGGARTINLPDASTVQVGKLFTIKDVTGNAATNNITIVPVSGDNIDNAAGNRSITLAYGRQTYWSDGTHWFRGFTA